jgi:hypothetical protein
MASIQLPFALPELFTAAETMGNGINLHGGAVGLLHTTFVVYQAERGAALTAQQNFTEATSAKDQLSTDVHNAENHARVFLKAVRAVLVQSLGEDWSDAWTHTGFPNTSTAIPDKQDERLALLEDLRDYFSDHPTMEVNTPVLSVTASRADDLHAEWNDAKLALTEANLAASQKKVLRDTAVATLRARMKSVIAELGQLLDPNDAMWEAFGLNRPGAETTPEIVTGLVVTAGLPHELNLHWGGGVRAERFRVWIKITGVDADFHPVQTVNDKHTTLTGLTTGQTVAVQVTAANDAGESVPSATVTAVVP